MTLSTELFLLGLSSLFFISILAGKASYKFGVPTLLLFLAVGMLFGSDGFGIEFYDYTEAQTIGTIALCIILFSGGLDTKISDIKPILKEGITLSTIGIILTTFIGGTLIWLISGQFIPEFNLDFKTSILLAAIMSSTDSASVFSILRSKKSNLRNKIGPTLELESGSNDPVAYIIVLTLISIINMGSDVSYTSAVIDLILQLTIGTAIGFLLGKYAVHIFNKINLNNQSLYPILLFTFAIFIFSITYYLKGNSYLAVYIGGLVMGNSRFVQKRTSINFFDGMAWMSQLIMFLTLGLLVNPHELVPVAAAAILISVLLILITRPLAVLISLLPFKRFKLKERLYISWVGLKGAVPIIFAILALNAEIPNARTIFNIVFFCALISLLVQGTTVAKMAEWLNLFDDSESPKDLKSFDIDFSDEIQSIKAEILLTEESLQHGNRLIDIDLPVQTLAIMVKRGDKYFIPRGKTKLEVGDVLLILSDTKYALQETKSKFNVQE